MTTNYPATERYVERTRSSSVYIAGILMIVVGILGLTNSYLILASFVVFGWLISGLIGLGALAVGIGLLANSEWAYSAGTTIAILNVFMGIFELLGALNYHYLYLGWVGTASTIGIVTLILAAVSAFLIPRWVDW